MPGKLDMDVLVSFSHQILVFFRLELESTPVCFLFRKILVFFRLELEMLDLHNIQGMSNLPTHSVNVANFTKAVFLNLNTCA